MQMLFLLFSMFIQFELKRQEEEGEGEEEMNDTHKKVKDQRRRRTNEHFKDQKRNRDDNEQKKDEFHSIAQKNIDIVLFFFSFLNHQQQEEEIKDFQLLIDELTAHFVHNTSSLETIARVRNVG